LAAPGSAALPAVAAGTIAEKQRSRRVAVCCGRGRAPSLGPCSCGRPRRTTGVAGARAGFRL